MNNWISFSLVSTKHVQSGSSCTVVWSFVHHSQLSERNIKHTKYDIFSVLSVPLCRTRPTKICMCVSQLYPKLRITHKKFCFHATPVQLVQNVHRFASCAIRQVILHSSTFCPWSTKAKDMLKSTVSALFASLCTKDLDPRWGAPWSNCDQSHTLSTNNSFHEPLVQRTEYALLRLEHCSVALSRSYAVLYFRMNTHQESKTQAK